jgi:hypothetical protein
MASNGRAAEKEKKGGGRTEHYKQVNPGGFTAEARRGLYDQ